MSTNHRRPPGRIVQINTSPGGVPKHPVPRALLGPLGLAGDQHRDRRHHGGPDRAVCLFGQEQIAALQGEGHPIFPGAIGENLTTAGIPLGELHPGDRLEIGEGVLIEITGYAHPCTNIEPYFHDGKSIRVSNKVHPGWSRLYARVLAGGEVMVGQPVRLLPAAEVESAVGATPGRSGAAEPV